MAYLFLLSEMIFHLQERFFGQFFLKEILKSLANDIRERCAALGELLQRRDDVQHETRVAHFYVSILERGQLDTPMVLWEVKGTFDERIKLEIFFMYEFVFFSNLFLPRDSVLL